MTRSWFRYKEREETFIVEQLAVVPDTIRSLRDHTVHDLIDGDTGEDRSIQIHLASSNR